MVKIKRNIRYKRNLILCFLLALILFSCETSIFGPNRGEIKGIVTNNVGDFIESVKISAHVIEENSSQTIAEASSNNNGSYELIDVLIGEIQLTTEVNGYKNEIATISVTQENNYKEKDFILLGAPELLSVNFDKNEASISNIEEIKITVSTRDLYNSDFATYFLNMQALVKNTSNEIIKIYSLSTFNNQQYQLFNLIIPATEFVEGSYKIEFFGIDEDNIKSNSIIKEFIIKN